MAAIRYSVADLLLGIGLISGGLALLAGETRFNPGDRFNPFALLAAFALVGAGFGVFFQAKRKWAIIGLGVGLSIMLVLLIQGLSAS